MNDYMDRYAFILAKLDVSESTTETVAASIQGYEVVAVAMPAALNPDGSSEMTFLVDPGDGIFRSVQDDSTAALTLTNVTAGDISQVQEGKPPICGAKIKLVLGAAEAGGNDLKFFLMCKPLI